MKLSAKRAWQACALLLLLLPPNARAFSQPTAGTSWSSSSTTPISLSNTNNKDVLFDMTVSNNGARCRIILYKKGLEQHQVSVVAPTEIGGVRSPEYLKINPQGKMPALVTRDGTCIAESDTIARYLISQYANEGPDFQIDNVKSNYLARLHDMYLTTIQGCMYKAVGPFGTFGTRQDALTEYVRQWNILDNLIDHDDDDMYLCGAEISLADATIFPSAVFAAHMLPKFGISPALPPKIKAWFDRLRSQDMVFGKVYNEIQGALNGWDAKGRWDTILGAGLRDEAPETLFDKIVAGEIPATIVKDDAQVLAFRDINPAAPAHVLVIPKERMGLERLTKASAEHTEILGRILVVAAEIARDKSLGFGDGARIVINDGPDGGQEIYHLHVHILGGRPLQWPPG